MKRFISTITSFVLMISMITCIPVNAEESEYITVDISGNYNYEYAFEVLKIINQYRVERGLRKWEMVDSGIYDSMNRAVEISIYYEHISPNGKRKLGDNAIGWHDKTPQKIVDGWMKSEPHRNIIMADHEINQIGQSEEALKKMHYVGIGCFQDTLGEYYWTFGFAWGLNHTVVTKDDYDSIVPVTKHIEVLRSRVTETGWTFFVDEQKTDREYRFGETRKIPYWIGTQPYFGEGPLDYSNFNVTSSDPSVVSVNEAEHNLTIGNAGTATITATFIEDPSINFERVITVKPKALPNSFYSWRLEGYTFYYDENEQKPKVINSEGLIEGKDYIVSYENNIGSPVGKTIATTKIKGINNYIGELSETFKIFDCPCYRVGSLYDYYEHTYSSEWTIDKEATCTTEGSKSHHCTVCGAKKDVKVIPKKEHSYVSQTTKMPTCIDKGIKTYTCSECGESYTESIPAKGHNFDEWKITKTATCTTEGTKTRQCSECGKTENQVISKEDHCYIITTVKEATCTENGETKRTCSECGESHVESVSAKGHNYTTTVVKPSYAAQGYTIHTCSVCGNSYKDNYKAKLTLANITKVTFTPAETAVKMNWSKVSGATGYRVYQYNTSTKKWVGIANTTSTAYTFKNLKAGTNYKFTVRAYKTVSGKTVLSPKYSTFTTSTNPATVKFTLTAGLRKATVKWSKVTGATAYKVYYKTSKSGKWKCLKTTSNKATSYTKTGLTKGKTYYFTVKAVRTVGGKTYNGKYTTKSVKVK